MAVAAVEHTSEVIVRYKRIVPIAALLIAIASPLSAQVQVAPPSQSPQDEQVSKAEREQAKKRNENRQASLKRDTDKLYDLATELKRYVDQSNESILSVNVVRKAEEIEKLARSVKDKMKGN